MKKSVVILGAGAAGLAAAWKILNASKNHSVTVLEQDNGPGGLAKTFEWNGFRLDLGPHRFHTEIAEIRDFMREFCEESMEWVDRRSRMLLNGRYVPYPVKPLPTLRALGPAESLRFLASAAGVLLRPKPKPNASYEEYVRDYYGDMLYRKVFEPFARKVWGVEPSQLDGEVARVRLRGDNIWQALKDGLFSRQQTYVSKFLYPPEGIGGIAERFARRIGEMGGTIHYNRTVRTVRHNGHKVTEVETGGPEGTQRFGCDILVSTVPLPLTAELADPAFPGAVCRAAEKLRFRSIVLLYLVFNGALGIRDTWLYYPEDHVPFSRISVPENFTRLNKTDGHTCLCLEYPCELGDRVWNTEAEDLAGGAFEILRSTGLAESPPADALAVRVRDGYPLYAKGYGRQLKKVCAHLRDFQNWISAGRQGLFRHNNTDQSIQMGLDAAEHILKHPNHLYKWYDTVERYNDYRIVD